MLREAAQCLRQDMHNGVYIDNGLACSQPLLSTVVQPIAEIQGVERAQGAVLTDTDKLMYPDNGSVRMFNIDTGKEIARFTAFFDGEWIAMTPEGYYTCSTNGDKYLNVRNGAHACGIENFRETFNRPDLVRLALAGQSLSRYKKIEKVNEAPVVRIVEAPDVVTGGEAKVSVAVEDVGGGVGKVCMYLNGSARLFGEVDMVLLTNRAGTAKAGILGSLSNMIGRIAPDDVFVFYAAGKHNTEGGGYGQQARERSETDQGTGGVAGVDVRREGTAG